MAEPYELLPEDVEYLNAHHSDWAKVVEGEGKFGLVVRRFPVPRGFTPRETTLMVLVPSGYPGVPVDMFYFDPQLHKTNGASIPALAEEAHFGVAWQRWSRHYQWTPGQDNLASHIEYVGNELRHEAQR